MGAIPRTKLTEAEYLEFEATAAEKHGFVNGEMFAMSGARLQHNVVCASLLRLLGNALRGGPCRAVGSDQRVRVDETGLYTYPDITVVCGKPETVRPRPESLVNPTVLVEVLSESTRDDDDGWKWGHYRRIASLRAYTMVDPDARRVMIYEKQDDGSWRFDEHATGQVAIASLGLSLDLAEVFEGLDDLPAEEPDPS